MATPHAREQRIPLRPTHSALPSTAHLLFFSRALSLPRRCTITLSLFLASSLSRSVRFRSFAHTHAYGTRTRTHTCLSLAVFVVPTRTGPFTHDRRGSYARYRGFSLETRIPRWAKSSFGAACKIAENDGRTLMDSTASDAMTKIGGKTSYQAVLLLFPIRMGVAIYIYIDRHNFGNAARTKIIYLRTFLIYRSLSYTLAFTPRNLSL